MKQLCKVILGICAVLTISVLHAQQGRSLIYGSVSENANAELMFVKTVNGKPAVLGENIVDAANPGFGFAIQPETGTTYHMVLSLLKQGHKRLEKDTSFKIPLLIEPGKNYAVKITPSVLKKYGAKGVAFKPIEKIVGLTTVAVNITNLSRYGIGNVVLQRVSNGELVSMTSVKTSNAASQFQLVAPIKEEGIYYITSPRFRYRVYLKPADALEININASTGAYELENGSLENKLMEQWYKMSLPITNYGYFENLFKQDSVSLDQYMATHSKLQTTFTQFKSSIPATNPRFNRAIWAIIDVDNEYAPIYLLSCLSSKKANKFISSKLIIDPPASFKQFVQPVKFNDASILEVGEGMRYITLYQKLRLAYLPEAEKNGMWKDEEMKWMMDGLGNDTVKAYFLKEQLGVNEVNNLSEFRAMYLPYKKYATPPQVKRKFDDVYQSVIGDTAFLGKSSYNFALPDTSGRMVSMKDFKGKVVFIDVWATWCGPCREQFPYMKEIEHEYAGSDNIVFVGISTDKLKDKQKWLNTIQKEKLPGIQLLDDFGTAFGRKYDITAIPRFLLIDKEGNWIEVRCPKPVEKRELKRYLDKALQDK